MAKRKPAFDAELALAGQLPLHPQYNVFMGKPWYEADYTSEEDRFCETCGQKVVAHVCVGLRLSTVTTFKNSL